MPPVPQVPVHRTGRRVQPWVTRIGRGPLSNDIVVAAFHVSRQHAELRCLPDGRYSIIDLNSHHGTYVNGIRVSQQVLREGDIVGIGQAAFRFADGELTDYVDDGRPPE